MSLVLPIKDTAHAKSRLELPQASRQQIAVALARHAVEVATLCMPAGRTYVVTSDEAVRKLADEFGARVVADPGQGLNRAVRCGVADAVRRDPQGAILVLVSDLPEVDAATLDAFLDKLEHSAASAQYVADRSGLGTTAVFCPRGVTVDTVFGEDSAARFEALGFLHMNDAPLELRSDVDTVNDLVALHSKSGLSWLQSAAG